VDETTLGKTEEDWTKNPRNSFGVDLNIFSDKTIYSPDETATLYMEAVFEDSTLLMIVMSALGNITEVVPMSKGVNSVQVPTGEICRKEGCIAYFWMFAPRREVDSTAGVPTSITFDP